MIFRIPVFFVLLVLLMCGAQLAAAQNAPPSSVASEPGNARFRVDELVALPHPMRLIKQHPERYQLLPEQYDRLQKEIIAVYPPQMHQRKREAWQLERQIRYAVLEKNATAEALSAQLDELSRIKRQITDLHIAALRVFRAILTSDQFQRLVEDGGFGARSRP
ncbi:hypothetical protein [Rhabdochromatium marinum]|uniref:hypothetical protein n=1 Tax=Rhabdochromatium marinum TaxID=48729 RepID=UPI0019071C9D|nr:hypothetical protein [Rhabdochromatium marinum]MBK1648021.1 hypothetical protein [Rhabdochromatium marinum]